MESDNKIRVVDWIAYDIEETAVTIGGMGGWFGNKPQGQVEAEIAGLSQEKVASYFATGGTLAHHRWKDYADQFYDNSPGYQYYEAMREAILARYKSAEEAHEHTGQYYQEADDGCPVFSDGKVGHFSYGGWGDLMAAIWSEEEDRDYCYMDFYM